MNFYKILDLPSVPMSLLNANETTNVVKVKDIGYGIKHYKGDRKIIACSYHYGEPTNPYLLDWISKNISPYVHSIKLEIQLNSNNSSYVTHIVHSDIGKRKGLRYFINLGGERVITSWYQEKDKPLMRAKDKAGQQSDSGIVLYENLTTLESVCFSKGTWVMLNTSILHDVDFIETSRTAIRVTLLDEDTNFVL